MTAVSGVFGQVPSEESLAQTTSKKKSENQADKKSSSRSPSPQKPSKKKSTRQSSARKQSKDQRSGNESEKSSSEKASEKISSDKSAEDIISQEASGVATPRPSPLPVKVSSLKPEEIRDFESNSAEVKQLLTSALKLTERNLGYVYGSADPLRGGMDCSGTIYFLLQEAGISEVPRSASAQYVWVRKANTFHAVVSNRPDSFEFNALQPGDLLFWTGTYAVKTDPPVTHSMIYLGKAQTDGRRLMVGASDGRTYRGEQQFGVSVFDFAMPKITDAKNPETRFIGYAKIPR